MCVVTYITLCWLSGYTFAIHTLIVNIFVNGFEGKDFMNQHCGTTIDFRKMSLHAIKLHLTTNSVYLPKLDCTMTVNATSTMQFMLYFKKMDISCDHDWLELHDGLSVSSPYVNGNCKSKEYHCNNGRCIADSLVCNGYNPCGDDSDCILTGTEIVGIIVSGPRHVSIAIESSVSCTRDWLEVFDGPNVNSRYVSGYCYSDEHDCDNGRCISDTLTCNGYNPCGDYSDCPLAGGHREPTHVQVVANTTPGYGTPGQGYNQPVPQQYGAVPYPQGQQPPTYQ
ncbi:LRP2-like protein [Mya arenaria]|uniref:LRP2-like protein n=1 Tax=Mya arenaria TaxID=6604 RepID=A0ABY7E3H4_MYAAR|nr:LRP2-like protein [Mya arenaria]